MQATTPTTSTQSKPRIRVLGPARYLVESFSQPGVGHQVDVLHLRCGCKAGQYGRRCKHLVLAIQYDAWRQRQRVAAPASVPVAPAPAPVPHAPAVEGDWHTSAAGDRHASAETGMRALQVAFE